MDDTFSALLQVRDVSMTFPGLKAVDGVSTQLGAGEIVALVGQNGSGKSTLVKILAGVHQPDPGSEVILGRGPDGQPVSLHFIHQDLGLVGVLSTIENLDLGRRLGRRGLLPAPVKTERRHAEAMIAGFGGSFDVTAPVATLSAAERTIVAITRALDGWDHPSNVLVLDEPTAALHGDEVGKLFTAVRRVAARGAGVIFISHRLDEVVELADRVIALRDGKLIADVGRGEYDHDDLVRLIAGEIASAHTEHGEVAFATEPVLSARGLRSRTIRRLDLDLHPGEIVGVSGVLGSGREELAGALFGASDAQLDELRVGGRALGRPNPRRSIAAGIAYVPAERHREGAVMTMSVRENMTLPRLAPLRRRFGRLDQAAERREVDEWIERVAVRPAEPERPLTLLSGGNQQKVVLAKWLRNEPRVLLLDEPTQGVDVGAKAGIFELIATAAAQGAGVLVCSSDAKELALICDRVVVMRDGEAVAEIERSQLSEAAVVGAGLDSDKTTSSATRSV
ncbi:Fructose import ATP-binding protein FruK [Baekduia alba]|uniref:sugar ABC transporter ATP-binding protein n=1 Tax=Baekduia alba TaxID=2997333 RepID=UPI00234044BC|nr:sugar ABC transporter ATP-binding protein [Baekduia alba]WCB91792.1 Fructose import ATP-binding protein FruK [Baekduia alba]